MEVDHVYQCTFRSQISVTGLPEAAREARLGGRQGRRPQHGEHGPIRAQKVEEQAEEGEEEGRTGQSPTVRSRVIPLNTIWPK